MYYWMKLNKGYNTADEAHERAQDYIQEPYVNDYYIAKARKYYYVVIELDLYGLKHAGDLGQDDPFA